MGIICIIFCALKPFSSYFIFCALKPFFSYFFCAYSDRFLPDKAIDLVDEAGSRVRLRHAQVKKHFGFTLLAFFMHHFLIINHNNILFWQLPEEARELDKELRQITKEKNEAVRGQDFEKVCIFPQKKRKKKTKIISANSCQKYIEQFLGSFLA